MTTFRNEPLLELRREAVRRQALEALAALDAKLPLEVPMLIGDSVVTGRKFASVDPSQPTRIVAHAHEATAAHVGRPFDRTVLRVAPKIGVRFPEEQLHGAVPKGRGQCLAHLGAVIAGP